MRYDQSTLDSYREERQWLQERLKTGEIWVNEGQPRSVAIFAYLKCAVAELKQGIKELEAKHANHS